MYVKHGSKARGIHLVMHATCLCLPACMKKLKRIKHKAPFLVPQNCSPHSYLMPNTSEVPFLFNKFLLFTCYVLVSEYWLFHLEDLYQMHRLLIRNRNPSEKLGLLLELLPVGG